MGISPRVGKLACAVLAGVACVAPGWRESAGYDWSGFHGGASFSRESVEIVGTPVSQAWSTRLDGPVISSPVLHNGRVYVGTRTGRLYCVDQASGAVVWEQSVANRLDATASIAHGRLYLGTEDGDLLCLDAGTGTLIWRKHHGGEEMSSPLVTGGRVILGVGAPSFDIQAFSEASGQLLWRYDTGQSVYSSPVVYRGLVYCASSNGDYLCLDLDGHLVWKASTPGTVLLSSPALRYGRCFGFPGHADPNLYAWDCATGSLLWSGNPAAPPAGSATTPVLDAMFLQEVLAQDPSLRQAFIAAWGGVRQEDLGLYQEVAEHADGFVDNSDFPSQPPFLTSQHMKPSSPAVGADHVVFVQMGLGAPNPRFSVVCMRATTGVPQWWYQEVAAADPIGWAASPAVSLDRVFVGLSSRLYTFDLSSGMLLDSRQLDGSVFASPAIGNGLVVVGTMGGTLYAFQTANHAPSAPAAPYSPAQGEDVQTATPALGWAPSADPDAGHGPGALRYLVEVDDDGELDWDCDNQYATLAGQTSLVLPAVPDDTRLVWRVRSVDPDGALSPWTPPQAFTVNKAGAPVQLEDALYFNAIPQDGQALLVWQDPPGQVFDGYKLTVRDEFGRERSPVALGRVEGTTVTGLSNFVGYTFRLVAYRIGGGQSPGISASATPRPLISVGNEAFGSVEEALRAAKAGDTVRLGAGTVVATDVRLKKGVSLVGVAPGYTILQGASRLRPVVRVESGTSGQPPLVSMMTVTGGSDGILVAHGGRAVARNLILMGLQNGVHLEEGARSEIVNDTISDNLGHGVWIEGGGDDADDEDKGKGKAKDKEKDKEEDARGGSTLRNNIIAYNAGHGILGPSHGRALASTFSDLFGNAQGAYGGTAVAGLGEIAMEPRFMAKSPSDYRLKADSPCVDAGDPADAFDQEPAPNGDRIDMGAYGNTPFAGLGSRRAGASTAGPGCFLSAARNRR